MNADNTSNGLTPELSEQVLRFRDAMNARKEFSHGRLLLLPPGTGFTGETLHGFEVRIVDRPLAIGAGDFPNVYRFAVTRNGDGEVRSVGPGPAGFINVES